MPLGAHQPLFLTGPLPAPWCPPAPEALPQLGRGWVTWAPPPPARLRQERDGHPLSSLSPQCGATHLTHCTPAGAHNCSLRGCCRQCTRCTGEEVERLGTLPLITVSSRWLEIFNTETKTLLLTALLPCSTRGDRGREWGPCTAGFLTLALMSLEGQPFMAELWCLGFFPASDQSSDKLSNLPRVSAGKTKPSFNPGTEASSRHSDPRPCPPCS